MRHPGHDQGILVQCLQIFGAGLGGGRRVRSDEPHIAKAQAVQADHKFVEEPYVLFRRHLGSFDPVPVGLVHGAEQGEVQLPDIPAVGDHGGNHADPLVFGCRVDVVATHPLRHAAHDVDHDLLSGLGRDVLDGVPQIGHLAAFVDGCVAGPVNGGGVGRVLFRFPVGLVDDHAPVDLAQIGNHVDRGPESAVVPAVYVRVHPQSRNRLEAFRTVGTGGSRHGRAAGRRLGRASRRSSAGLPEHAVISAMHPASPAAAKRLTALIRVPLFPFTAID